MITKGHFASVLSGALEMGWITPDDRDELLTAYPEFSPKQNQLTDNQVSQLYMGVKKHPKSAIFSNENWFAVGVISAETAHGIGEKK